MSAPGERDRSFRVDSITGHAVVLNFGIGVRLCLCPVAKTNRKLKCSAAALADAVFDFTDSYQAAFVDVPLGTPSPS
jgi:hypothetical protein